MSPVAREVPSVSRVVLLVVLGLFPLACATRPPTPAPPENEASVRPGVNDRFLSNELTIDWARNTFEGESREIFAERQGILEALEVASGMNVADVGAGTGFMARLMAGKVAPRGKVYAVEVSPKLLEHLRQQGWSGVEVVAGEARSANLPENAVDLVFLCDTYHHLEYPRTMLASLHRALRSGGRLVVVDFERIPGVSTEWVLGHVRAGKEEVIQEIVAAGFTPEDEVEVEGLKENYLLRFRRP